MTYLVWLLAAIAIALGFLLGLVLGIRHDYEQEAIGMLMVGYTGEPDEGPHIFLNLKESVEHFHTNDYVVLRVQRLKARK